MENHKIESYVKVLGITQGGGICLLINKENNDSTSRCVLYHQDGYKVFEVDQVEKATTFNAFTEVSEQQENNLKALMNRNLTNAKIDQINNYLKNESK